MHLLTLGLNHRTAGLALRERMAFPAPRLREALHDMHRRLAAVVPEGAILSTCNRTEFYCATRAPAAAQGALLDWLAAAGALPREELRSALYALPQDGAVRHAFRVASGLDSMVLGEPQILGQMKAAARAAQQAGALGSHLHQLFQCSFAVAKEVRSRTEIGSASVSLAAAAVRCARGVFPDLAETRVLLVGAGEMIELAATHLAAQRPREIVIANRSPERAGRLAERVSAQPMRLAELPERLAQFDIVVSGTASSLPIIGLGMVERAARARAGRPLVLVDLAVPRDIEPEAGRLPRVFLYSVDDLAQRVRSGAESRRAALVQAEAIIDTRVESFMHWMAGRQTVPLLCTLNERAQRLRAAELERARRRLERGAPPQEVLERLASALTNKFLHGPRSALSGGTLAPEAAQRLLDQWLPPPRKAARNTAPAQPWPPAPRGAALTH